MTIFAKKQVFMDANSIIQIISNVGFPIVMCGVLIWNNIKMQERHEKSEKELGDILDRNTTVLTELTTLIKNLITSRK